MNNANDVKQVAYSRWREVLEAAGLAPELLDGKGHPCPKCGGKDRFAAFKDVAETGGVLCRQCHSESNGDGLATLQWLRGCSFPEAVAFVAEYFGLNGHVRANGKPAPKPKPRPASNKPAGKTFPTAREAVAALERQHGKRSDLWTYRDASGEPVGLVVRWNLPDGKKDIRPVSKHGDGWRIGGMADPRPLYGLPDLDGATRVYVCEGEKAADAVRSLGLTATTSPHGCESPAKADWGPLAGKEVTILPDNDSPGGKYADAVAALLAKLTPAPVVKLVELPGLPVGGDAVEWIEAHGAAATPESMRAELERLADSAEALAPEPQAAYEPPAIADRFVPFPVDALPEPLRGFVAAGAESIGCDSSFVALPLLAVVASAIGNTRRIQLKRGWTAPPIIWAAVVGDSGTAKTPGFKLATRAIRERERKALKRHEKAKQRYKEEMRHFAKALDAWKKDRKTAAGPPEEPQAPQADRCTVSDSTVEALAPILQENPRGVLLARDELRGWIGSFDRYANGKGGADAAHWLSMHNAENMIVDRKTGVPRTIFVSQAAVCICGGIQPAILHRALGSEHREDGLAARLLLTYPPRIVKEWREADINPEIEGEIARLLDQLYQLQPVFTECEGDDESEPRPVVVNLTAEAKRAWIEFYNAHAQEQADLAGELSAAWSKLEEYAARLALVVHFARWAANDSTLANADVVDLGSVAAGIRLTNWFKREAVRVYSLLAEPEEARENRRLVEWIERKGGTATAREVQQCCRWLRAPGLAEAALDDLVKASCGNWEPTPPGQRGQPTRRFRLHTPPPVYGNSANTSEKRITVDVDNTGTPETDPLAAMNARLAEAAAEPDDSEWGTI